MEIKKGDKVLIRDHSQLVTLCADGTLEHKSAIGGYYDGNDVVVVFVGCCFPTDAYLRGDGTSYDYGLNNDALCFSKTKKEFFFIPKEYLETIVCPLCGHRL